MKVAGTYTRARPTGRRIPIELVESTEHTMILYDGREVSPMIKVIPEEELPAMRAGYICAQCIEELDMAFPEHCPVCNFPMRELQAEYLGRMYVGNKQVGPSTTLADEALHMQELRQRQARELGIWTPPGTWM